MWRTGRSARLGADGALEVLDGPAGDDPYADPDATFVVVCDTSGRSALSPARVPLPPGWHQTHAEDRYELCLDHLNGPPWPA